MYLPKLDRSLDGAFSDDGEILFLMEVEYHRIPGYPFYYIDEYGTVISTMHGHAHKLSTWKNKHGHKYVHLCDPDSGTRRKFLVHRLVAMTFIPNPEHHPIVRHLDDCPENNEVGNLAWGTCKDNTADCMRNDHDFRKEVYCYELDRIFRSCREAARCFEVSPSLITCCCKGDVKVVRKKYHLCFLEDLNEHMANLDEWLVENGNYKPVIAENLTTGETIRFKSRKEAAEKLGVSDTGISNVIAGRLTHSGGWTFREGRPL